MCVRHLLCPAAGWEAQAQSGLAAEDRLKDMLEEAAAWSGGSGGDRATVESALLAERSRVAELQLQVCALGSRDVVLLTLVHMRTACISTSCQCLLPCVGAACVRGLLCTCMC